MGERGMGHARGWRWLAKDLTKVDKFGENGGKGKAADI